MTELSEYLRITLALVIGLTVGAVFFGGLWWTVRQGIVSPRPALWFLVSMLLRMGIATVGFYFVSGGGLYAIGACLVGFLTARIAVTWFTRPVKSTPTHLMGEASHPT